MYLLPVIVCVHIYMYIFEGATMYHASTLINKVLISTASITIIDGQNIDTIAGVIDSEYNPCLPETMHSDKRLTVTFSSNITAFKQWFPPICANHDEYSNEYMFDGAQKWIINNLIVTDYDIADGYGLVRTESVQGDITFNNCSFMNIESSGSTHLFETWGSFHLRNSKFFGIALDGCHLIYADHNQYTRGGLRDFVITGTHFGNIITPDYLIYLDWSWNDVK